MPLYTFKNLDTEEIREYTLTYEEMKEMERHPDFQRIIDVPQVNSTNSNSATYVKVPDKRKAALNLEKQIADTTAKMYSAKPEDRAEYKKEINNMKKSRKSPD